MTKLTCAALQTRLPLFVGGDLDVDEMAVVRTHLIDCVGCRNEAAALRRAVGELRKATAAKVPGADDAALAAMHQSIMARIEVEAASGCGGGMRAWAVGPRGLLVAAALALAAAGFWWGAQRSPESVWDRAPIVTPAVYDEPKAVPYSGPRARMRLLGVDSEAPAVLDGGDGAGLRGRDDLRSLVDEDMILPRRQPKQRRD